jgi:hypothetical protein
MDSGNHEALKGFCQCATCAEEFFGQCAGAAKSL